METLKRVLITAILVLAADTSCASTPGADSERPPSLDCQAGPLHKRYGQSQWLVYGCNDARSAIVVSDSGNPASPFYFILYVKPDGSVHLYGEGNGKKSATQAAFNELKALSQSEVAALVSQAQAMGVAGK